MSFVPNQVSMILHASPLQILNPALLIEARTSYICTMKHYIHVRPNQEQLLKMQLYTSSGRNRPAALMHAYDSGATL